MAQRAHDSKKPEQLRFVDGFPPPLVAGKYTVAAAQTLELRSPTPPFKASRTVHVAAPRFSLAPDEIYSVYPPEGQSGAFHTALPHVVFTRKTLPWEREIGGIAGAGDELRPPWMALLTLDEDEIAEHRIELSSVPVDELRKARQSAGLPDLLPEPGESADPKQNQCRIADMPTGLFREIAPAIDELRFLAHARQIGTEDKDVADMLADGWFAVIIGNRLSQQGKRNHGLLVSLEGVTAILKQQRKEEAPPAGLPARIWLPVLKHWQYDSAGPTFRELLEALTESRGDRTGDVWLRISPNGVGAADKTVREAMRLGYTALTHATRQGGKTVSWYRGPLVPVRLDVGPFPAIHANADEALQYDEATGLFDVSYAAAWQLGRLLALQKADFANSLMQSRSGLVEQEVLREAGAISRKNYGKAEPIDSQKARLLLQDDLMIAILTEWWQSAMAKTGGDGQE